tara:strand:+ start:265 stop:1197 length:933 start_codon:yes stop_codon:yes gene_type:complete
MPEIVITEFVMDSTIDNLTKDYKVHYDRGLAERQEEIPALLSDCKGLIVRNRTKITAELLDAAPNLKVIGRLGVGLDQFDLEACATRNIEVCPALGANTVAVAEYTITAMMILLKRGIFNVNQRVIAGEWPRNEVMGLEARKRTFGLIGFGAISREVAVRVHGLGMEVLGNDPYVAEDHHAWGKTVKTSAIEVFEKSDVISCHVPLTEETYHIIDAAAISKMRTGTILINASRGGVLDEAAVIDGLKSGKLGGAAIDVFEKEPINAASGADFADVPNLLITPHVAWATDEANVMTDEVTVANVRRVLGKD